MKIRAYRSFANCDNKFKLYFDFRYCLRYVKCKSWNIFRANLKGPSQAVSQMSLAYNLAYLSSAFTITVTPAHARSLNIF